VAACGGCVADSLALSPTGWLYVGAPGLTAIRWDAASGELGEPGAGPWISTGGDEPGGAGVAVAGDGSMYAADTWEHKLLQHRPVADGFELVRTYREFDAGAQGVRYLRSIALSPDGKHLYVAAGPHYGDRAGTVATFSRDPGSGDLTFVSLVTGRLEGEPFSVTINGGAEYTDDPRVQVTVSQARPGPGSLPFPQLELANDGGFVEGRLLTTRPDGKYAWTLASTGPERLPKTVYARPAFEPGHGDGGSWRGETASDTIVLDETRPVVVAARRVRVRALRVRARDRLSGVRRVQFAGRRGGHARWLRYRARKRYAVRSGEVWVRVRDRAGNRSRWRLVRAAGGRR
jgi:hypothetical protein